MINLMVQPGDAVTVELKHIDGVWYLRTLVNGTITIVVRGMVQLPHVAVNPPPSL